MLERQGEAVASRGGRVVGAKEIAVAAVAPGGTHAHCVGFEIWNEAGETVASLKRGDI